VIRSNRSCGNCAGKTIRGIDVAALFVNRDSSGVWCAFLNVVKLSLYLEYALTTFLDFYIDTVVRLPCTADTTSQ
jgi:hypothetical protein